MSQARKTTPPPDPADDFADAHFQSQLKTWLETGQPARFNEAGALA